jgi:hypothetical protein
MALFQELLIKHKMTIGEHSLSRIELQRLMSVYLHAHRGVYLGNLGSSFTFASYNRFT